MHLRAGLSGTSAGPWTQSGRLATPGAAKATGNQPTECITGSKGAERLTHIRAPLEAGQLGVTSLRSWTAGGLPAAILPPHAAGSCATANQKPQNHGERLRGGLSNCVVWLTLVLRCAAGFRPRSGRKLVGDQLDVLLTRASARKCSGNQALRRAKNDQKRGIT